MPQKHPHYFGRAGRCNCLLWILLLRAAGRVTRLVKVNGHWLGVTPRGTWVHFKRTEGRSLWYRGRPHAFRR